MEANTTLSNQSHSSESAGPRIDIEAVNLSRKILYPILFPLAVFGYTIAVMMMKRNSIGRYSSSIYLIAIFTYDKISIMFWYYIPFLLVLDKELQFNDGICKFIMAFAYIGRAGTLLTSTGLALERALVLLFPTKYQLYATPRAAILVCALILAIVASLSGVALMDRVWIPQIRYCLSVGLDGKGPTSSPSEIMYIATIVICISSLLLLNITIGAALYRKRVHRSQDPVQNAIAAARSKTKQLNKVNLIAFIMTVTSFCEIIPILTMSILIQRNEFFAYESQVFAYVALYIAPIILACKPYLLPLVSPKIRKELWELIRCNARDNRLKELGVNVKALKPKSMHTQFQEEPTTTSTTTNTTTSTSGLNQPVQPPVHRL